jgi:hypothetical protein
VHSGTSKLLLAAGFVVVGSLAVGLVRATHRATEAAASGSSRASAAASPAPAPAAIVEPAASAAAPSAKREPRPLAAGPHARTAKPEARPEVSPGPSSFKRDFERDADGNIVAVLPVDRLREQIHVTDAPMRACIERSGQRPTGKATITFTVVARAHKLLIETTGVQDEETLAAYPALLDCMHQTAHAIVLDSYQVAELGTDIYVRRHVRLENGELVDNSIWNFSYIPR